MFVRAAQAVVEPALRGLAAARAPCQSSPAPLILYVNTCLYRVTQLPPGTGTDRTCPSAVVMIINAISDFKSNECDTADNINR